jgi:COP9 signalosome complex subunit 8
MANGPPTPPATAAELVDDAKENPSNVPAALEAEPQQAPLKPNAFQLVFPTIANLAAQGKLQELIQVAEQTEISVRYGSISSKDMFSDKCVLQCDGDCYQSRLLVLTPLVLAYLILDEL